MFGGYFDGVDPEVMSKATAFFGTLLFLFVCYAVTLALEAEAAKKGKKR